MGYLVQNLASNPVIVRNVLKDNVDKKKNNHGQLGEKGKEWLGKCSTIKREKSWS